MVGNRLGIGEERIQRVVCVLDSNIKTLPEFPARCPAEFGATTTTPTPT